jgi:hypothetical protein
VCLKKHEVSFSKEGYALLEETTKQNSEGGILEAFKISYTYDMKEEKQKLKIQALIQNTKKQHQQQTIFTITTGNCLKMKMKRYF